ncbi:MAG: type 4a pilus biogenesis protein PilO [Phycisphaeraceae bacterium]
MNIRQLSPKQIDLLGIAVVVIATVVVFVTVLQPLLAQRLARADQRQQMATQREHVREMETAAGQLRAHLERIEQTVADAEAALEPSRHLNQRVAALASLAEEAGLELTEIQPGRAVAGMRYEVLPIQLAGSGTYADYARFLHQLSAQFVDVTITTMSLQGESRERGGRERVTGFRLTVQWHALPPQTASTEGGVR